MSHTVKETFGGDYRFREAMTAHKINVIETKGIVECPKVTGMAKLDDIESKHFIALCVEFMKGKKAK